MDKRQLIDQIRQFNTSAEEQFLAQFDEQALAQYLDHLQSAAQGTKRIAGWIKREKPMRMAS